MRKLWTVALLTIAILAIPSAAAAGESGQNPATEFTATLTGAQEVPPVATAATGRVTFELDEDGTLEYEATLKNITGVFMAHIHAPAPPGQNAGVMVWLCGNGVGPPGTPPCTNRGFEGRVHVTAAVLNFMRTGLAYANVHTMPNHPGGEVRGLITAEEND